MRALESLNPVYAITDYANHNHQEILRRTELLFQAGIDLIQYRNKTSNINESIEYAKDLKQLCKDYSVTFIINDNPEIVEAIDADGLHIGKDDTSIAKVRTRFPNKIIGVSCYNHLDLAIAAEKNGADYVAFGAFFSTTSKTGTVHAPLEIIQQAKQHISVPIVAIGGITPDNAIALIEADVDFISVISGLYGNSDPYSAAQNYLSLFNQN